MFAGDDAETFFVTAPPPRTPAPTRIWVLGDGGFANAPAMGVRDAYRTFAASRQTDVMLLLGDNAYFSGTDAEYQMHFFEFHASMLRRTFLWPAIGNHDTALSATPPDDLPYFQMFTLPTKQEVGGVSSGTEKYY